jgi:AcrR family transcriptional regulator
MELRNRIIQEASILFSKKGVRSMTMSDIATTLGISKRTLYEIFHDKEDLLEECINTQIEQANNELESMLDGSEDAIDALMRIYAKQLSDAREFNKSLLHDLRKYYAPIFKKIETQQQKGYYMFIPLLEKGIQQGLIREDSNFEIMIWLIRAQIKALIDDDYIPTDKYPAQEFVRSILLNSIRGMATLEGIKQIDERMEKMKQN